MPAGTRGSSAESVREYTSVYSLFDGAWAILHGNRGTVAARSVGGSKSACPVLGTPVTKLPINPSIAVIDGDQAFRDGLIALVRSRHFIAKGFPDAEEFLASTRLNLTTCVIAEVRLAGISGLELYGQLLARGTPIPTILITAHADEQARTRALGAGVAAFLSKPLDETEMLDCIKLATTRSLPHSSIKY